MLTLLVGTPGSGKTLYAIHKIIKINSNESKEFEHIEYIYNNIAGFKFEKYSDSKIKNQKLIFDSLYVHLKLLYSLFIQNEHKDNLDDILQEYCKNHNILNAYFIIDEAHNFFDNQDKVKNWWFTYHRHLNHEILLITQNKTLINTQYRNIPELFIKAQPRSKAIFKNVLRYFNYTDYRMSQKFSTTEIKVDSTYFDLYTSGNISKQKLVGRKLIIAFIIKDITVKDHAGAATSFVKNVDYTIDAFGLFKTIGTAIAEGTVLKISYKHLDESKVVASDIIGAVNSSTEARSGLKCFDLSFNLFGFNPKILIAPTFSDDNTIAVELISAAEKFRAITYLDAPFATTVQGAISGRGSSGTINFNTSSNRAELLYPMLKTGDELFPYSAFLAGVRAFVDNTEGYWVSDSNHEIKGITGVERNISAGISDPNSEANLLNEKGITTVFNSYGSGLRVWGNRSAAYPSNTAPDNFVCVRRTADVINESVELACLQFIDQPITQGWIDSVRESVNSFLRTLQGRGAILDGVCKYIPEDNPTTELANGHINFYVDFMPATPAERITFNSFINIDYLSKLK